MPAGVQRDRFRRRRAHLLDAQGRGPSGGLDPRRRLRRLAGGGLSGRERQEHAVAENLHASSSTSALLAEVEAVERNEHATLVDARPASYSSTARRRRRPSKAYGHIPGAINLDSATFYDPATNRLRPKEQLATIAASLPAGPVVTYCNTGHWAATDWFVLSAVLGRPDVRLYDGSMVEWTADPQPPGRELAHAARRSEEDARPRLVSTGSSGRKLR